jgi:2-phosphoglycerate kinase
VTAHVLTRDGMIKTREIKERVTQMIIWLNGPVGVGKNVVAYELNRRLSGSLLYRPDNVGVLLKKQLPAELLLANFQDYPEWRQWNYQLLRKISLQTKQTVIVPMRLANANYFDEIIGKLQAEQIDVRHYTLTASPDVLKKRLQKRGDLHNQFMLSKIQGHEQDAPEIEFPKIIDTSELTVPEIADQIAKDCALRIKPAMKNKYAQGAVNFGDMIRSKWN